MRQIQRNTRSVTVDYITPRTIETLPKVDPYYKYLLTEATASNLEAVDDFSFIVKNSGQFILDELNITISNSNITITYPIYTVAQSFQIAYTSRTDNFFSFVRKDYDLQISLNGTLINSFKLYYKFSDNWTLLNTTGNIIKFYKYPIEVQTEFITDSLTGSTFYDSLLANDFITPTFYEDIVISQFLPDDNISNTSIVYNNSFNPITKTFQSEPLNLSVDLFKFTISFEILNFSQSGVIFSLNNSFAINYSAITGKLNGSSFTVRDVNILEVCFNAGIIYVFVDGKRLISQTVNDKYIHTITIDNLEFKNLSILEGVLENDHLPVYIDEVNRTDIFYPLDQIHFKDVTTYPKNVRKVYTKETTISMSPNTSNNVTLPSFSEIQNYEAVIDIESDFISVSDFDKVANVVSIDLSLSDFFDVSRKVLKLSYHTDIEHQIININNTDSRVDTFLYNIVNSTYFEDGYFPNDNILATINNVGVTVGSTIDNVKYPRSKDLNSSNFITLTSPITISSFLIVYKEEGIVSNRGYLGNDNNAFVNGGVNGEVYGTLILDNSEFFVGSTLPFRSNSVDISSDGNVVVIVDNLNEVILLYEKVGGAYVFKTVIDTELDIGFSADVKIQLLNSTTLILGLKDGLASGEGTVQIWKKQGNDWTRRLNINSPVNDEQGFGISSVSNQSETLLYVGELSTSNIYIFEQINNIYNTTPIATLSGKIVTINDNYIFGLDTTIRTCKIYNITTYALIQTLTNVDVVSAKGTIFTTTNLLSNTVNIYENLSLLSTLTSTFSEFGFSLSVNTDKNVVIGSPTEGKVYIYEYASNYTNYQEFTDSNFFGYYISIKNEYLITTNFNNKVTIYTNDVSQIGNNVNSAYVNSEIVTNSQLLDTNDFSFIHINLTSPSEVLYIGKTNANLYMDGIFVGWLGFNRNLTAIEVADVGNEVRDYLRLREAI